MSTREYKPELIEYEVEDVGFKSNTVKVEFNYDGKENGFSEDLAYEFMQDFTTATEILGHKISVLSFKPGIKQEGNAVYIPHKSEEEAEEIAEEYIEQLR
ncbi:hypothetical protein [Candidatus Nanohalobium constans]|uniref:Uncharacterized protein n=1 Tax=Candidatus Nanohalobium constans TaxID=2565781 RepID=A0A5Q0UFD3_9ARCH|nr:hypothetical protein [Candidatus Nanohalobium constans]QGA80224.1 hypothetical protein LC1Nh_0323 [Candidatus Nanohalobium constans]